MRVMPEESTLVAPEEELWDLLAFVQAPLKNWNGSKSHNSLPAGKCQNPATLWCWVLRLMSSRSTQEVVDKVQRADTAAPMSRRPPASPTVTWAPESALYLRPLPQQCAGDSEQGSSPLALALPCCPNSPEWGWIMVLWNNLGVIGDCDGYWPDNLTAKSAKTNYRPALDPRQGNANERGLWHWRHADMELREASAGQDGRATTLWRKRRHCCFMKKWWERAERHMYIWWRAQSLFHGPCTHAAAVLGEDAGGIFSSSISCLVCNMNTLTSVWLKGRML